MIENSFIFLEGISTKAEGNIWKQGVRNWDNFINANKIQGISRARKLYYDRRLKEAKKELYSFNSPYFIDLLHQSEMWRLYDFFREDAVFLDIEATGIYREDDFFIIGLYDGINTKIILKNNFDYNKLKDELMKYKLIVSFNGASFDMPFLNKRYHGLLPKIPHFDVKSITGRIGLNGGLKEIEKAIGIKRNPIVEKFTGGDVSMLWRMYRVTGDEYYLNLLIEYNEDDIINLKRLADFSTNKLKELIYGI